MTQLRDAYSKYSKEDNSRQGSLKENRTPKETTPEASEVTPASNEENGSDSIFSPSAGRKIQNGGSLSESSLNTVPTKSRSLDAVFI